VSNALQFVHSTFVLDVSRIERGSWFEEDDPTFLLSYGTMLDHARDHDELAFFDPLVAVAKFHAEAAFDDQEHFVFVLVVVKHEGAVELDELNLLSVKFGGDAGFVEVRDLGEFFGDVDFGHRSLGG
jgi:hypothetical protein